MIQPKDISLEGLKIYSQATVKNHFAFEEDIKQFIANLLNKKLEEIEKFHCVFRYCLECKMYMLLKERCKHGTGIPTKFVELKKAKQIIEGKNH